MSPVKDKTASENFPIVCLGGATVDLDAYTKLIGALPADLDAAIVVINHLKAVGPLLLESLTRCSRIKVEPITEGMAVQPNRIFVLKEGWDLHLVEGEFRLRPVSKPTGWTNVVTVFLGSMARNWHGQLIAVILGGLDGDGAAALCDVKRAGGITIAQKVDSGGDPNMPSAAIASGFIDLILPAEDIATQIVLIAHTGKVESLR